MIDNGIISIINEWEDLMGFRFLNDGKREEKSNLLESGRTLGSVDTEVHELYIKTVWTCAEIEL